MYQETLKIGHSLISWLTGDHFQLTLLVPGSSLQRLEQITPEGQPQVERDGRPATGREGQTYSLFQGFLCFPKKGQQWRASVPSHWS